MKSLKVYVAGKMSKSPAFTTYKWRNEFLKQLSELGDTKFISLDPTNAKKDYKKPHLVFASDVHMIADSDLVIVYLTDDISVGGSQEILIAKHYGKPVLALAPRGGKFNKANYQIGDEVIEDYIHPFVYATCDVIASDINELAEAVKKIEKIKPKTLHLIDEHKDEFEILHKKGALYTLEEI